MKNVTKFTLWTLIGGVVGGILYKVCKESVKEVKEEIKKEEETLKEAGIDPKASLKEKDLPGDNFVENVLDTLIKKTDWDDDTLKTTDYENHDQSLWGSIRVMQRDEDTVSVFIQIPPYLNGFRTLKQYKEDILEAVRTFTEENGISKYKWRYVGYWERISDELTESGNYKHKIEEISENDCINFSQSGNYSDGIGRLVSYYYKNNCENLKRTEDLISVSMFVEITLPIKNSNNNFGIDIVKMIKFLKMLNFDLNIMEREEEVGDVFPSIIFFRDYDSFDVYYHTEENENGILNTYYPEMICTLK